MAELALSILFVVFVFLLPVLFAAGVFLTLLLASVITAPVVRKLAAPSRASAKPLNPVPHGPTCKPLFAGRNGLAVVGYIVGAECRQSSEPLSTSPPAHQEDSHPV
jgi:hypothetical protein